MIFSDDVLRQKVNGILHPATFREVKDRIEKSASPLVIYESAIPREARFRKICDRVLYVYASEETRLKRLQESRGYTEERSRSIMQNQMSDRQFRRFVDAAVSNNGTVEEAEASLEQILSGWGINKRS